MGRGDEHSPLEAIVVVPLMQEFGQLPGEHLRLDLLGVRPLRHRGMEIPVAALRSSAGSPLDQIADFGPAFGMREFFLQDPGGGFSAPLAVASIFAAAGITAVGFAAALSWAGFMSTENTRARLASATRIHWFMVRFSPWESAHTDIGAAVFVVSAYSTCNRPPIRGAGKSRGETESLPRFSGRV